MVSWLPVIGSPWRHLTVGMDLPLDDGSCGPVRKPALLLGVLPVVQWRLRVVLLPERCSYRHGGPCQWDA